ncbi:MAG: T9SS type A sorting domain-containing protein [Ignavibacteriaceae bacterium]|nr:T9SS type A sorting domain-containing protein [Ignavibacteriaceae bacterium]
MNKLFLLLISLFISFQINAATKTATVSGNWSDITTWGGSAIPTTSDVVYINNNITVTVDDSVATCGTLNIYPNDTSGTGNVVFLSGGVLTIIENLTISANALQKGNIDMTNGGTLKVSGTAARNSINGIFTAGLGTVEYNGSGDQIVLLLNYNNLIYSVSGIKTYIGIMPTIVGNLTLRGTVTAVTPSSLTINGNLDVGAGTTFSSGSGSYTLTVKGTTTVSGALTVSNNSANTFAGDVIINPGGTWNETGTGAINFAGSLQNDGSFTTSNVVHTFNGTATQFINGTNPVTFINLTINNSNGITLGTNCNVNVTLNMTAGNIALGGNSLMLGVSAASFAATGTLNYTAGLMTGSGTFTRWFYPGSTPGLPTTFTGNIGRFPMGVGTNDRTVLLAFSSTSITEGGSISVSHTDAAGATSVLPFVDSSLTIVSESNMNWTIAQSGLNLGTRTMNIQITAGGICGVNALADIDFTLGTSKAGGAYVLACGSFGCPSMSRTGMSLTDVANIFYVGATNESSLPVELSSFTSIVNVRDVNLNWNTQTGQNLNNFVIERATYDGFVNNLNWTPVQSVKANLSGTVPSHYSFTDKNIDAGKYQYRLKMIDYDGSFKYSKIIEAVITLPASFELSQNFPNPFNPTTKINYNLPNDSKVTLEVYNIIGERIAQLVNEQQSAGYYSVNFGKSSSNITSGIYIYKFTAQDNTGKSFSSVKKMMLLK